MTRNISQEASDHIEAETIPFAVLLELEFDSGPVNLWWGIGDIVWDGKTWIGTGEIGSLSGVTEATDLSDTVIRATLSHLDNSLMPDFVDELTNQNPVGRGFSTYLAFFNPDNSIKDTVLLSAGLIDAVHLTNGETGAISLDLVSEAGQMARVRFFRMDDQHQQKIFPGDKGFQFVTGLDPVLSVGSAPVRHLNERFSLGVLR